MKYISLFLDGNRKKFDVQKNIKRVWRKASRYVKPFIPFIVRYLGEMLIDLLFD